MTVTGNIIKDVHTFLKTAVDDVQCLRSPKCSFPHTQGLDVCFGRANRCRNIAVAPKKELISLIV